MNDRLFRALGIGILVAVGFSGCASLAPRGRARSGLTPAGVPVVGALVHPLPGSRVISCYGRRGKRMHNGVDLKKSARGGDIVVAACDGIVAMARRGRGYGLTVAILHADGTLTRYAHLSKLLVQERQQVIAGQKIGIVGATGNATTPHLHFETLTCQGGFVDPVPNLQALVQSDGLNKAEAITVSKEDK